MLARQAVLLTPSRSPAPAQLLSYKQNASVSPFFAALTTSILVSPLFATLTENAGVSLPLFPIWNSPLLPRHHSPPPALQCSFLLGDHRMPTRDDAWNLLCEYTASESLRKHMLAVE